LRILFYQWHSFLNRGIEKAFEELEVEYDIFFFQQSDWEIDTGIVDRLERQLKTKKYTIVFSVNFAPMVSMVCQREGVLYVSWIYDNPIHIRNTESMKNNCNRIFFFDRVQANAYKEQGIQAFHMPLAGDVHTFGGSCGGYLAEVSFIGRLYQTDYAYYCKPLEEYLCGYLDGILMAQSKVYGGYFLNELLDDSLLRKLNKIYAKASNGTVSISKKELEYMMACEITSRERYLILAFLSKYYNVHLYSTDKDERLSEVAFMGYADYYQQMPKVFQTSKINLNISLKMIQSGIPLRVFDVLACGGFLITNFQSEMAELFEIGKDFVVYENIEDLCLKTEYYLRNEREREEIARHGRRTIEKYYTVSQQIEKILREVNG